MTSSLDSIFTLTIELSRLVRKSMAKRGGEQPMNMLQAYGLSLIKDTKNITMTELADQLKISTSTATTFIDRLVKIKWVTRKADANNRKVTHLALTKTGESALDKNMNDKKAFLAEIVSTLSSEDRAHLERILRKIHASCTHHFDSL